MGQCGGGTSCYTDQRCENDDTGFCLCKEAGAAVETLDHGSDG